MAKLRLTEADRKRFGVTGDLPIDLGGITNREAIALKALGYPTPRLFRAVNQDEDPGPLWWTGLVWLALRRAGVDTDLDTLEFNIDELGIVADTEPVAVEGKAPPAPDGSTSSARKSSTSTATSRPRSKPRSSRS